MINIIYQKNKSVVETRKVKENRKENAGVTRKVIKRQEE